MKSIVDVCAVAALALTAGVALPASSALAADLSAVKAALPPPGAAGPLWNGFYAGLNAGYAFDGGAPVAFVSTPVFSNPLLTPDGVSLRDAATLGGAGVLRRAADGFIGGGQIGYNRQYGAVVFGLEADIQGLAFAQASRSGVTSLPTTLPGQNWVTATSASKSTDYLGTVRGRVGIVVKPTLMVYGMGGLAYGGVSSRIGIVGADTPGVTAAASGGSFSDTLVGWSAGGGVEWAVCRHWSVKAEYLHYDLGHAHYSAGARAPAAAGDILWSHASAAATRFDGHIARVGVNYHIDVAAAQPALASRF